MFCCEWHFHCANNMKDMKKMSSNGQNTRLLPKASLVKEIFWFGFGSWFFEPWDQSYNFSRTRFLLTRMMVWNLVWTWIKVIFCWLRPQPSSTDAILIYDLQLFLDWTIWIWLLTYEVPTLSIRWSVPLGHFKFITLNIYNAGSYGFRCYTVVWFALHLLLA